MGESCKSARAILLGLLLVAFLVGAIVVLLLLIHKYGPHDPTSAGTEHDHHLDTEELHRLVREPLPADIRPLHYALNLSLTSSWARFDNETNFYGKVDIVIETGSRPTKWIVFHARKLEILGVKLFWYTESHQHGTTVHPTPTQAAGGLVRELQLVRWFLYPPRDRMVIEAEHELPQRSLLVLEIQFGGELITEKEGHHEAGLMKIKLGNKVILSTTGSTKQSDHHSRRIFPCFDDLRFLSFFFISLTHPSSHVALSNTPELQNSSPVASYIKTTTFTPRLPLSTRQVSFILADVSKIVQFRHPILVTTYFLDDGLLKSYIEDERINEIGQSVEDHVDSMQKIFKDVGPSSMRLDCVILPQGSEDIDLSTIGLLTLPARGKNHSERAISEKVSRMWFGGLMRPKTPNDTWLVDGLAAHYGEKISTQKQHHTVPHVITAMEQENPVTSRPLSWNNQDLKPKEKVYLNYKSKYLVEMLQQLAKKENFEKALQKLIKKQNEENQQLQKSLKTLEHDSIWLKERSDKNRLEIFRDWMSIEKRSFNSISVDELVGEIEKFEQTKGLIRKTAYTWSQNPNYPVVKVEMSKTKDTLAQSRFVRSNDYYHLSNYTWEIPLHRTVLTSASDQVLQELWLNTSEATFHHTQPSSDLVVFNKDKAAYARFLYTPEDWEKLIKGRHLLGKDTKYLINDLLSLTRAGYVNYEFTLKMLESLKTDVDGHMWYEVARELNKIKAALFQTPAWNAWTRYVHNLVSYSYDHHITTYDMDNYTDNIFYVETVSKLACSHGYAVCARHAHDFRKDLMTHLTNTSASSQPKALLSIEEFALKNYDVLPGKNSLGDDFPLLAAFIAYDLRRLDRQLEQVKQGRHSKRSFVEMYSHLAQHTDRKTQLWAWFRENIRKLQELFDEEEVAEIYECSVQRFYTETQIQDARYVLNRGGIRVTDVQYSRIQDRLTTNSHWFNNNYKKIHEWLTSQNY